MAPANIVEEFLIAIEQRNFTKAEDLLSNSFRVTGVGPVALDGSDFMSVHRALGSGIPDFRFNYEFLKEKAGLVTAKFHITGTHTKSLPAPYSGLRTTAPTNKSINMPDEIVEFNVRDNKIQKMQVTHVEGGGLPGLLKQIGIEMRVEA
ncbi:MAG: ester cyclase [Syntrophomonadaceae bacterium]